MKILIFDTETTGLPKHKVISPDTLHLWPNIVQFSYLIYNTDTSKNEKICDFIVKLPEEIIISEESTNIHGITSEMTKKGTDITSVFDKFFNDISNVDQIVGHNVEFDLNMIRIELLRIINNDNLSSFEKSLYKKNLFVITRSKKIFCTMQETIDFCNIQVLDKKGKSYAKYPKLSELHEKLFQQTPKNLHNSLNDILVTLRCYVKIKFDIDVLDVSKEVNKLFKHLL